MSSAVRTAWDLPRAPGAPPRTWRDWTLVGVLAGLAVLEGLVRTAQGGSSQPALWSAVVVELAVIATLLWRRAHPGAVVLIAFGIVLAADAVRWVADIPVVEPYTMAFLLILPYTLVRWGSGREIILVGALMLIAMARALFVGPVVPENVVGGVAVVTASLTLGAVFRVRAAVRAERLERARVEERERLARDLHDTVAHHVSAIAIRAQAGLAVGRPEDAADALRVIESEARRTLDEMRSVVRTLRDGGVGAEDGDRSGDAQRHDGDSAVGGIRSPAPGAADLHALADSADPPPVSLRVDGDLDSVPAPIVTALYRIVQESITNARTHAVGATRVEVELTVADDIRLRVHDDGTAASAAGGAHGFGIAGMAERAAMLGGTCSAGAEPTGGWTVAARLPLKADAR